MILRKKEIIDSYNQTLSYSITGKKFDISRQRVHQIVKDYKNYGRKGRIKKYKKLLGGFFVPRKKCRACKIKIADVLHHKNTINSDDSLKNLLPLCKDCHIKVHQFGLPKYIKEGKCEKCLRSFNKNVVHSGNNLCSACYNYQHRKRKKGYGRRVMKLPLDNS